MEYMQNGGIAMMIILGVLSYNTAAKNAMSKYIVI